MILVILAILAVILVPKLTGYIDKTKEKEAALAFSLMAKSVAAASAEIDDIAGAVGTWVMYQQEPPEMNPQQQLFADKIHAYLDPDFSSSEEADTSYIIQTYNFVGGEKQNTSNFMKNVVYSYYPQGYIANKVKYTYQNGVITKELTN